MQAKSWLLAAALAVGFPLAAQAQSTGYYIGLGAGGVIQQDADLSGAGIDTSVATDPGWSGLAAFGYRYGNNFRAEVETAYRNSRVDSISGSSSPSGDITAWSTMINGLYDFKSRSPFTPYLGLGLGVARVNYDGVTPIGGSRINDSDNVLAYQGIAGVSYALGDNVDLTADYRYLRGDDPDLTTESGTSVGTEFSEQRIILGLRWSFGGPETVAEPTPTPAAAGAPAPEPAPSTQAAQSAPAATPQIPRTYLVFFDWDRSDLRSDAREILNTAAANTGKFTLTQIKTTGHADRSGPAPYNMRLSQKRAETVKAELIRLGVPEGDIVVQWKGESEPLVQTPDGVREPQNRRVEIILVE